MGDFCFPIALVIGIGIVVALVAFGLGWYCRDCLPDHFGAK